MSRQRHRQWCGSTRGFAKRFSQTAPRQGIRVLTGHRIAALTPIAGRAGASVSWVSEKDAGSAEYPLVLIALSAHAAAGLLAGRLPALGPLLGGIDYRPVATAVVRYARPVFSPDCRALVFPRDSPLSNAGACGVRDLDLVRYTFSGAAARPLLARVPDAETLADLAERTAAPWLALADNRRLALASRVLPQGLCAYSPRHSERLARIRREVSGWPGLALCGDYWRGASIEACFRSAEEAARAAARLYP
jgi:protoporphyrinogen/coproporphyrinogen III oxidase